MGESVVGLWLGGRMVAEYVIEPDLDSKHGPRPYLHPVRTLGGTAVTDALPEDHVWHLGASLAVQDVSGTNLWGGRTYVRDVGYTWRSDHGRMIHDGWISRAPDRLAHRLRWCDPDGGLLLNEERALSARLIETGVAGRGAWALDLEYTLTAPAHRDITLGSPATNGRPGGAGYGGFFWRVAPGAEPPKIFTARGTGEEEVNGSTEPWVALARPAYTLVFCGLDEGNRWFVRGRMYPGVCAAFAFGTTRVILADTSMAGRHSVIVVDGELDRPAVGDLLVRGPVSRTQ